MPQADKGEEEQSEFREAKPSESRKVFESDHGLRLVNLERQLRFQDYTAGLARLYREKVKRELKAKEPVLG